MCCISWYMNLRFLVELPHGNAAEIDNAKLSCPRINCTFCLTAFKQNDAEEFTSRISAVCVTERCPSIYFRGLLIIRTLINEYGERYNFMLRMEIINRLRTSETIQSDAVIWIVWPRRFPRICFLTLQHDSAASNGTCAHARTPHSLPPVVHFSADATCVIHICGREYVYNLYAHAYNECRACMQFKMPRPCGNAHPWTAGWGSGRRHFSGRKYKSWRAVCVGAMAFGSLAWLSLAQMGVCSPGSSIQTRQCNINKENEKEHWRWSRIDHITFYWLFIWSRERVNVVRNST